MKKTTESTGGVSLDKAQFDSLLGAIQNLIKVIASTQIKGELGTRRNARFLKVFGFNDQEVADLLDVTHQAVSKALKEQRQQGKPTKGESPAVEED
jgi:hypothetical protein